MADVYKKSLNLILQLQKSGTLEKRREKQYLNRVRGAVRDELVQRFWNSQPELDFDSEILLQFANGQSPYSAARYLINSLKLKPMIDQTEMPFLDHLEELRWRIIKSLMAVVLGAGLVFLFIDPIFRILLKPATSLENPPDLQVLKVHGMFMIKWGIAFVGGIILAIPVITYQFWKFVAPGMLTNERRYAFPVILFSFIAFIIGVLFAYYVVIPFFAQFFHRNGIR